MARLATVSAEGVPHLVPVTFAVLDDPNGGDRIVFVVDDKPKSTPKLRRMDNIAANPSVCLLVDVYDDDWSRLWWVRADGSASVLAADTAAGSAAVDALAARYPAYVERRPEAPSSRSRCACGPAGQRIPGSCDGPRRRVGEHPAAWGYGPGPIFIGRHLNRR